MVPEVQQQYVPTAAAGSRSIFEKHIRTSIGRIPSRGARDAPVGDVLDAAAAPAAVQKYSSGMRYAVFCVVVLAFLEV